MKYKNSWEGGGGGGGGKNNFAALKATITASIECSPKTRHYKITTERSRIDGQMLSPQGEYSEVSLAQRNGNPQSSDALDPCVLPASLLIKIWGGDLNDTT